MTYFLFSRARSLLLQSYAGAVARIRFVFFFTWSFAVQPHLFQFGVRLLLKNTQHFLAIYTVSVWLFFFSSPSSSSWLSTTAFFFFFFIIIIIVIILFIFSRNVYKIHTSSFSFLVSTSHSAVIIAHEFAMYTNRSCTGTRRYEFNNFVRCKV